MIGINSELALGARVIKGGDWGRLTCRVVKFLNDIDKGDHACFTDLTAATPELKFQVQQPTTAVLKMYGGAAFTDYSAGDVGLLIEAGEVDALCNGVVTIYDEVGPVNAQDYLTTAAALAFMGNGAIALEAAAAGGLIRMLIKGVLRDEGNLANQEV